MFSFIWSSSTTKKEKEKENKTPIEVIKYSGLLMSMKYGLVA